MPQYCLKCEREFETPSQEGYGLIPPDNEEHLPVFGVTESASSDGLSVVGASRTALLCSPECMVRYLVDEHLVEMRDVVTELADAEEADGGDV